MNLAGYGEFKYNVWLINGSGGIHNVPINNNYVAKSVINLKSNTKISSGDGTKNNPYIPSL